jgi:endonuclease/exonuclease/phosphatase family metal-dependent hydrolase
MQLRLAFYNIHSGLDSRGERNCERIGQWLRDHRVDVCGVVEVEGNISSGRVDWLSGLARSAGMDHLAYGECFGFDYTETGHGTFGNGVLSRVALRSEQNLLLTPAERQWDGENPETEPRCALHVILATETATDVSVVITHFPYGRECADRAAAAETLAQALAKVPGALIVGGDFNAELDGPELAPVRALGFACRPARQPTYPTGAAESELDLVLVRGGTLVAYAVDLAAEMSDHYPVLADVQL